jgi:pimeloyl-ACP methyl ester carboxylesterase
VPDALLLPGRLPPDQVFPSGRPGHHVRWLDLPGGERVRAVVCEPPAADAGEAVPSGAAPPAVVCVHGWGCSAYSFHRVLRPIADLGVRAVALDLRGHGWSSKPVDVRAYTPEALSAWLFATLDVLGVPSAVVVGHSLGGSLAIEAALTAPGRVAALVLVAPLGLSTVARLRTLRQATPALLAPLLPRLATRAAVRLGLAGSYGPGRGPTPRDVDEYWAPTADPRLALAVRLVAHASDWAPAAAARLGQVTCPVRVLLGDHDNLIAIDAVRPLAAAFPRGSLEVLAGVGHVPAEEVPGRVIAAVAASLADARADTRAEARAGAGGPEAPG